MRDTNGCNIHSTIHVFETYLYYLYRGIPECDLGQPDGVQMVPSSKITSSASYPSGGRSYATELIPFSAQATENVNVQLQTATFIQPSAQYYRTFGPTPPPAIDTFLQYTFAPSPTFDELENTRSLFPFTCL